MGKHSRIRRWNKLYSPVLRILALAWFLFCSALAISRLWKENPDGVSPLKIVELSLPGEQEQIAYGIQKQWLDDWYCNVSCTMTKPCVYKDQVDLRIIVVTYDRSVSVKKCLDSILNLDTLGDRISVDIWIDRSMDGVIDADVNRTAHAFKHKWSHVTSRGRACVHHHPRNAFIIGQWINTYRPVKNTKELALILEDDVSISPMAYRWLKGVHGFFQNKNFIAGYTLQMENLLDMAPVISEIYLKELRAPPEHKIFLFPVLGTWGFAPHPESWRKFQDFYYSARKNVFTGRPVEDRISPRVVGIRPNTWYGCRTTGRESVWDLWHEKFCHDYQYFTVYSNLKYYTGRPDVLLDTNRQEKGLHYSGKTVQNNSQYLMTHWRDDYVSFSDDEALVKYNYDGSLCTKTCCFSTTCKGGMFQRFWQRSWCQKIKLFLPTSYLYN